MLSFAVFGQSYARRTAQDQIKYDEEKKHRQNSSGLLHPNNHWSSLWCKGKVKPNPEKLDHELLYGASILIIFFQFQLQNAETSSPSYNTNKYRESSFINYGGKQTVKRNRRENYGRCQRCHPCMMAHTYIEIHISTILHCIK